MTSHKHLPKQVHGDERFARPPHSISKSDSEATAAKIVLPYMRSAVKSSASIREGSVRSVHEGVKGPPNLLANPDRPDPEPALTVPAQAHSQER
jgi:hypothetical protein